MTSPVDPPDFVDDPADPDLVAGLEVYDRWDWSAAEPYLRRAAQRGNITAIFKLANVRDHLGDEEEAVTLWQLASDHGHDGAANNLGLRLVAQGRVDEALTLYRSSAAAGNVEAMFNLGVNLQESGQDGEAQTWLGRRLAQGHGRAAAFWGRHLLGVGRREEGISVLEQGAQLGNLSACLMLSVDGQETGDYEAMVSWASKALEFTDDLNEQHQVGRAWGLLGLGLVLSGHPEEAIVPLQEAATRGEEEVIPIVSDLRADGYGAASPQPFQAPPQVRFCPMCGTQREALARFCSACGASLAGSS